MTALTEERGRKLRKFGVSAAVGAVVGAVGAYGVLEMEGAGVLGELAQSQVLALLVAVIYLLMGVASGFGIVSPRLGARFLNVEDAEELTEQRAMLLPSAVSCILLALGLAALALAGDGSLLSAAGALGAFVMAIAISIWLSRQSLRHADELMRQVMSEGSAVSFYLAFAAIGGWAVLAHLGFVAGPAMLDIVTLFYALTLLGCFWVIGRRGMMVR